jgi:hypothetical protein
MGIIPNSKLGKEQTMSYTLKEEGHSYKVLAVRADAPRDPKTGAKLPQVFNYVESVEYTDNGVIVLRGAIDLTSTGTMTRRTHVLERSLYENVEARAIKNPNSVPMETTAGAEAEVQF